MDLHHLVSVLSPERCPGRAAGGTVISGPLPEIQGPTPGAFQVRPPDPEDHLDPSSGKTRRGSGGEPSGRGPAGDMARLTGSGVPVHRGCPLRGLSAPEVEMVQDLALDLGSVRTTSTPGNFHVVYVCTYSVDEPVEEVVEAARNLPDIRFSVTGDPSYAPRGFRESLPPNVR